VIVTASATFVRSLITWLSLLVFFSFSSGDNCLKKNVSEKLQTFHKENFMHVKMSEHWTTLFIMPPDVNNKLFQVYGCKVCSLPFSSWDVSLTYFGSNLTSCRRTLLRVKVGNFWIFTFISGLSDLCSHRFLQQFAPCVSFLIHHDTHACCTM
jgi:hypothetical protein